jgi:ADYC domain
MLVRFALLLCLGAAGAAQAGSASAAPPAPAAAGVSSPAAHQPLGPGAVLQAFDDGGAPVTLRIDAIESEPGDPELSLYALSRKAGEGWEPYCAPDRRGRSLAIPLPGSWDGKGGYRASARVTFGCTSGAIGKCVLFGYKPWKTVAGRSLRDFHLACVRMVRADYCGDGVSHTRDGTFIDLFDPLGIQKREEVPDRPVEFEAGWSPGGATYLAKPRWGRLSSILASCRKRLAGRTPQGKAYSAEEVVRLFPDTLVLNDHAARAEDRLRR